MQDLRDATTKMAQQIGGLLNNNTPVPLHKIGFLLVTFEFGPNSPAHYASNTDPDTLARMLQQVVIDITQRKGGAPQPAPSAIIVP